LAAIKDSIVKHRGIDYGVQEDRLGIRRWIIYPKTEDGPKVVGDANI
jgi:hypothetical protein